MKILLCSVTLFLAALTGVFAQTGDTGTASLSGTVITQDNTPLIDAVVYLHKADSTLVKTEITDEKGAFVMPQLQKQDYFVTISFNNIQIHFGSVFLLDADKVWEPIMAIPEAQKLDEVVITKEKQYIERQQGKLVLNVQESITGAGSSAFEILERAPGVMVDNNDNISLRGRGGVAVHIDGRPVPMTGTTLANYLKGIPAGIIEKIELVNNPSAKYEAAGSSIINIILKKDKNMGTNGSVTTAYTQGVYSKFNNNLSLNHRTKKVNLFTTLAHADRRGFNDLTIDRRFYDEEQDFTGAYKQDNYTKIHLENYNIRAGADFYPNKKHTIGILAGLSNSPVSSNNKNVSLVYDDQNVYTSRFITLGDTWQKYSNYSVNLNHRFAMDTIGTTLTTDFDYARYNSRSYQNFDTRYYDTGTTEIQDPYILFGDIDGKLDIYAGKTDYRTTLAGKVTLEAGLKASYVEADNDQAFFDRSTGVNVPDPTKSNRFIYKENINAAYVSGGGEFGKWNLQLGLRVENTNISGEQVTNDDDFTNSYTQFFPNVFAGYTINDNHGLDLSYSKRITRAGYDQLNPFKFYMDPTTYREGNPYLKPQVTHSIDFTHTFKRLLYTTLTFSRTTDNITDVITPSDEDAQLTVQGFRNLNTVDYYILSFVAPIQVTKWWNSTNSLSMYQNSYSGAVAGTVIENQGNFTGNINSVNTFKISNSLTAELSGMYRARETYAFMDIRPLWRLNGGLEKKFKNNSSLKLSFTDVFFTGITEADVTYDNYKEYFLVKRDGRTVALSYTYNFGNSNQAARRRSSAADDIKQRTSSGSA